MLRKTVSVMQWIRVNPGLLVKALQKHVPFLRSSISEEDLFLKKGVSRKEWSYLPTSLPA